MPNKYAALADQSAPIGSHALYNTYDGRHSLRYIDQRQPGELPGRRLKECSWLDAGEEGDRLWELDDGSNDQPWVTVGGKNFLVDLYSEERLIEDGRRRAMKDYRDGLCKPVARRHRATSVGRDRHPSSGYCSIPGDYFVPSVVDKRRLNQMDFARRYQNFANPFTVLWAAHLWQQWIWSGRMMFTDDVINKSPGIRYTVDDLRRMRSEVNRLKQAEPWRCLINDLDNELGTTTAHRLHAKADKVEMALNRTIHKRCLENAEAVQSRWKGMEKNYYSYIDLHKNLQKRAMKRLVWKLIFLCERDPNNSKLVVISGYGSSGGMREPPIRNDVIELLEQIGAQYDDVTKNPGIFIVHVRKLRVNVEAELGPGKRVTNRPE